jgi:2Fe-2S ferredoxin
LESEVAEGKPETRRDPEINSGQAGAKAMVTFKETGLTFEVEPGKSILDVALDHDVPLNHSCGGNCACASCHVIVHEGMEHLSEKTDDEDFQLEEAVGLTPMSRLSCQSKISGGNIVVEIPPS